MHCIYNEFYISEALWGECEGWYPDLSMEHYVFIAVIST